MILKGYILDTFCKPCEEQCEVDEKNDGVYIMTCPKCGHVMEVIPDTEVP